MRHPLVLFVAAASSLLLAGCAATDARSASSTGGHITDDGGAPPPPPLMRKTVSGDLTWQVTFDAMAKSLGRTDCSFTRHYEGTEDLSVPWICPTCVTMFQADVTLTAGLADCYDQINKTPPLASEWIGYAADGTFLRGSGGPMDAEGTATQTAAGFDTADTMPGLDAGFGGNSGLMTFVVTGKLAVAEEAGDPMHGFEAAASYACGWPKSKAPAYAGDYVITKGEPLPDGLFKDACDEVVRLDDFAGAYLVVDMSAMNCPPCQQMAGGEEAFVSGMKAQGIDVRVITMLANSLTDPFGSPTSAMLKTWIDMFKLSSPVLADRSWGVSMFPGQGEGPGQGFSPAYPSWVVVGPDLRMLASGNGYDDTTGFSIIQKAILADAKP